MMPFATHCPWPGCGSPLEHAADKVFCPRPGHYVRVHLSDVTMGDVFGESWVHFTGKGTSTRGWHEDIMRAAWKQRQR